MSWYLLAAIPVFALMVLVHELGHFLTAKWAGIRVDEFAIGFPPRIASIKRGETTYSINALPIGGYVKMPGENGETVDEHGNPDPRTFGAKPAGKRAIVLVAGVTMNLLLAVLLFSISEALPRTEYVPLIQSVVAGGAAEKAGVKAGDVILSVNGVPTRYWSDMLTQVQQDVTSAPADAKTVSIMLVVSRPKVASPVAITVVAPTRLDAPLGIQLDPSRPARIQPNVLQAPLRGVQDIGGTLVATGQGIQAIIRGLIPVNKAVTGPVGIVNTIGLAASTIPTEGFYIIIWLAAFLSLNLAFVNLLPIPGLDGGRLLLIGIEVLRRGKRLSPEREALVNLIGMGALLFLVLLVTINDVSNLGH
jgi:regulator of sigma E protease